MEIKVDKSVLLKAIGFVGGVSSQKPGTIPALSNLLLETQDKQELTIIGTDLEVGISTKFPAEVLKEGSITLPSKKLQEIIRELPNGAIEIHVSKNNAVSIKGGKSYFKIMGLGKEDYPNLPMWSSKDGIGAEQAILKEGIHLTSFAISHDETRYVLNGVLLSVKGSVIRFVATDGRRLAFFEKKFENTKNKDFDAVIPSKALVELAKILDWEGSVQLIHSQNQIIFNLEHTFLCSRLIEGKFPDYDQVIPKNSTISSTTSREELLQAVRRASILTSPESPAVKMDFLKGKILISSRAQNLGEAKEEVMADTQGGELAIGFNPHYLMDVLKNMDTEQISLHLTSPDKPGLIKGRDSYKYVIMPMQLN